MGAGRLILREIAFRKLNFASGVLAVWAAVGLIAGLATSVERYRERTAQEMRKLEDDYRKIMRNLGFNVLILPKDQNLGDLYAEDYASKTMPEEYAARLAAASLVTVNHVLPSLQEKVKWPEHERTVLIMGTRGELPAKDKDAKKPLLELVKPGTVVAGAELGRGLKLNAGDKLRIRGREFTLAKVNPERGNKDDITLWLDLKEAQDLLGKPGRINAILALECVCAKERLSAVRQEIEKVLPETQVIEFSGQALTRAEARMRAATEAEAAVRRASEFAALVGAAALLAGGVWLALAGFANVRERRKEIGVLRAIGWRRGQILRLFLGRALLIGLLGAVLGVLSGQGGEALYQRVTGAGDAAWLLHPGPVLLGAGLALFLAALGSWLPAWSAAREDPAEVLREN